MTITTARPTRRTLVRGAAWSVPVVSIAATAPAFASSTQGSSTFGEIAGTAQKWSNGNVKHVSWDILLANGPVAIESISITFSYLPSSGGGFEIFHINGFLPTDNTWTSDPITGEVTTATAHHGGIAADTTTRIHTDFEGDDNAAGTVSAVATIKYVGITATVNKTISAVTWGSGSQHVH